MVEAEQRSRRLRIESGSPAEIEDLMNRLLDEYVALIWNISAVGAEIRVTAVLLHSSEMRKAALVGNGGMGRIPR